MPEVPVTRNALSMKRLMDILSTQFADSLGWLTSVDASVSLLALAGLAAVILTRRYVAARSANRQPTAVIDQREQAARAHVRALETPVVAPSGRLPSLESGESPRATQAA